LTAVPRARSLAPAFCAPMNKAALVDEVQKLLGDGTSKAAAERATDGVLAAVKRGLRRDKEVALVGFGTFAVAVRPARRGFNPHTKRPMKIRAMKTVRFKAGAELRSVA
jgi:DNA-binding protein HU-beta